MLCLQWERILLSGDQNMPFHQFIRSSIQKIQDEKICTVECEDLQAQSTKISGKCEDNMMLLPWFSASASREKQSVSEHGSKGYWVSPVGIFGKMKWTKKAIPASFPRRIKPYLLLHSFYPHLINTPAQPQNTWIIHVKPNFKEKKSLKLYNNKVKKNAQENSKSQEYLLFPRTLAEHLPPLCSSLDTILYSVRFMEISAVCTREGPRLSKDSSGCCFAAELLSLLDRSCGCVPAQCPAWAMGLAETTGHWQYLEGCPSQAPTRAVATGKTSKKTLKKPKPPQPNTQTPKTLKKNKLKFHYPCSGHAASKQLPKRLNLSGVQQKQNNPATPYNSTVTVLPPQSPTSSPKHCPTCPCFPALPLTLSTDSRELHCSIYTQALKGLHSSDSDGLQSGGFWSFYYKLLQETEWLRNSEVVLSGLGK